MRISINCAALKTTCYVSFLICSLSDFSTLFSSSVADSLLPFSPDANQAGDAAICNHNIRPVSCFSVCDITCALLTFSKAWCYLTFSRNPLVSGGTNKCLCVRAQGEGIYMRLPFIRNAMKAGYCHKFHTVTRQLSGCLNKLHIPVLPFPHFLLGIQLI